MPFARITGQGMSAIALSVALLWGCLIAQRVITRTATDGRARALQEIRMLRLRNRREPASTPAPPLPWRSPATIPVRLSVG
jgi:hypothetical protein